MNSAAQKLKVGSAPASFPNLSKPPKPSYPGRSQLEQDTTLVVLPDPTGYSMLVALPTLAQQTAGGIYIPETVNDRERVAAVVGTVIAMGKDCYLDQRKFPTGPWCKVGDTVMFARYSGMRFKTTDLESGNLVEYRMLSDDMVVGVVPEGAHVEGL